MKEDNTLHWSRRNRKEFESADRTVSKSAVYPRLAGKRCASARWYWSWINSFIHGNLLSISSTNRYKKSLKYKSETGKRKESDSLCGVLGPRRSRSRSLVRIDGDRSYKN